MMSFHQRKPYKIKVLILGSSSVGKTAFAVRFITKRFIGEYDANKETLYTHRAQIEKDEVFFEILDSAYDGPQSTLENNIRWADGFLILYSVTDKHSYSVASELCSTLKQSLAAECKEIPLVVVANKTDLLFCRKVTEAEGYEFSKREDCTVFEISVAEGCEGVNETMTELFRQVRREQVRQKENVDKSVLNSVKRAIRRKIYSRSQSDTV